MIDYSGTTVSIIGGGSGIGLAISEQYLKKGAIVHVFDINIDNLKDMVQIYDNRLKVFKGNVKNSEHVKSFFKEIKSLDILIYSAGVFPDHSIKDMSEDEWDHVVDINLKGAFLSIKYSSEIISNGGHIITISSGSYRSARVGSGHYCASKAGLVMLTKTAALELSKHNIKVNSIAPGLIENPILDPNYKMNFVRKIPIGRIGAPEDIAKFISLFTSENNTYITGQVIQIDGGLSAGQYDLPFSNMQEN